MPIVSYLVKDGPNQYEFAGQEGRQLALAYRSRNPHPTLWQVEKESEAEADKRRLDFLQSRLSGGSEFVFFQTNIREYCDKFCPPPAPKETQLDWNTGEPINRVPVWRHKFGRWIAGVTQDVWAKESYTETLWRFTNAKVAIGNTAE